ncbi:MAG: type I-C CRISPR-associated protein Cas8c/Csd1 [Tahibacter sp.]
MILQALNKYYERKSGSGELAPEGFERKEIPFVLVIDRNGKLVQIEDTRSGTGKKRQARSYLVPQAVKKTSGVSANLLWDTAEYVLGVDTRDKPERVAKQHEAFVARLAELAVAANDPGLQAAHRFLTAIDRSQLESEPAWKEVIETNPPMSLRIIDDAVTLICERPAIVNALRAPAALNAEVTDQGFCLVRAQSDAIARLHPSIKGVWGAQSSGANIVSFNLDAFNSYGKGQGANAPIGELAAFTYTTALNHLLRKGSTQRMQVGDASTVFWAANESPFEVDFAAMFGVAQSDDPDRGTQAIRNLYAAVQSGVYSGADAETEFFVLGLAPNAARIAIRFWHSALVKAIAPTILQHFEDLKIVRPGFEPPYIPLWRVLSSVALLGKSDNVPPNLGGDVIRSILSGAPYPATLLQSAIRRCRAEQDVGYARAAVIKASLNRLIRHRQFTAKELLMSLDRENTDAAYRLGRLFAALERIQSEAQPGINATIRDRYYGAACSSPASVFPILLKLKNHHLSKLDNPRRANWFEKTLGEIFSGIAGFPAHLGLQDQGLFAVGYYHQQQDFYTSKAKSENAVAEVPNSTGETNA